MDVLAGCGGGVDLDPDPAAPWIRNSATVIVDPSITRWNLAVGCFITKAMVPERLSPLSR